MTKEQKKEYETADALREIFGALKGRKFRLDCGHYAESIVMQRKASLNFQFFNHFNQVGFSCTFSCST